MGRKVAIPDPIRHTLLIDIRGVVIQSANMISIRETLDHGRGVFASAPIRKGEIIERAPVLVLPDPQWVILDSTQLRDYHYAWGPDAAAIVLGFGSIYNHSYTPNAVYVRRIEEKLMEYVAIRDIEMGEEITVNYNGSPEDHSPLWFNSDQGQLCRTA
ncbi:MAG TPA: SET domain-containing protein [Spirochaetia bacterium]|nr:SET domain-containing protein [Spirochaetia bacterium]